MPNMVSRRIQYTDDFGTQKEFTFKIKSEYATFFNFYQDPLENVCSGKAPGFSHRYLQAKNADGESIKFPVNLRANIAQYVTALKAAGFVCIDLVGEEFGVFPGIGTPGAAYTIPDGFSDKVAGTFEYTSDVLGNIFTKVAYELAPTAISTAIENCIGTLATNSDDVQTLCSSTLQGFSTRRIIAVARNTTTGGGIVRQAPVAGLDPTICRGSMAGVAICVGYKGESIKRLDSYTLTP